MASQKQEKFKVVLTVDDLPVWPHWKGPGMRSPASIVESMIKGLATHNLSGIYSFSNSGTGMQEMDTETKQEFPSFLDRWVAAGNHIGNHTHSHVSIGNTTVEHYCRDLDACDEALAPWIDKAPSRLFRFATDTWGESDADATALQEHLQKRNYHSAPASCFVFEWFVRNTSFGHYCRPYNAIY